MRLMESWSSFQCLVRKPQDMSLTSTIWQNCCPVQCQDDDQGLNSSFFQKGSSKFSNLRYSLCQFRVVRCLSCLGQGPEVEEMDLKAAEALGLLVDVHIFLYCAFVQLEVSWDHSWKWAAPRRLGWEGRAAVGLCQAPQWGSPGWHFRTVFAIRSPAIIKYQFRIHLNSEKGCNEGEIASRHGLSLVTNHLTDSASFFVPQLQVYQRSCRLQFCGCWWRLFFFESMSWCVWFARNVPQRMYVWYVGRENVVVLTTLSKSHNDVRILQQIFGQVRSVKKWGSLDFFASFGTG